MNSKIIISGLIITVLLLSGCAFDIKVETHTHVCYGILTDVFTDGTMASLDFKNGSVPGITFYGSPNEAYDSFAFELLEIGAMYTFVYHLENNVPRPGIDMYYINAAPVIDEINRGNHSEYWVTERGCIE